LRIVVSVTLKRFYTVIRECKAKKLELANLMKDHDGAWSDHLEGLEEAFHLKTTQLLSDAGALHHQALKRALTALDQKLAE
jgi:hypothetical protein